MNAQGVDVEGVDDAVSDDVAAVERVAGAADAARDRRAGSGGALAEDGDVGRGYSRAVIVEVAAGRVGGSTCGRQRQAGEDDRSW